MSAAVLATWRPVWVAACRVTAGTRGCPGAGGPALGAAGSGRPRLVAHVAGARRSGLSGWPASPPDRSLRHAAARPRPAPAAARWHGGCLGAGQLQQRAGARWRGGITGRFSPIRLGWFGAQAPSRVAPRSGGAAHSRRYSPADGRCGSGGSPTWRLIRRGDSSRLVLAIPAAGLQSSLRSATLSATAKAAGGSASPRR